MSNKIIVIETTIDDKKQAEKISRVLVEEKLVACAQISSPIESVYTWQQKVCTEQEFRVVFKTLKELQTKVEARIKELHPYEVAEIVFFEKESSAEYFEWLKEECEN